MTDFPRLIEHAFPLKQAPLGFVCGYAATAPRLMRARAPFGRLLIMCDRSRRGLAADILKAVVDYD